ncbi:MAG: MFS transporter [Anaerolineae bacterium]|nr:MFS transporter [Anaerolineae bacterium]
MIDRRNPYLRRLLRDPLILPVYVPAFVLFLGSALLSPVLPLYAEDFEVSYAWIGAVASARALGMLLMDIPSGLLLRRLGHKRAILLGMAVTVGFCAAMSWAGSIQEAFLYQLVSGFGMALYGIARHAYITEHAPKSNRGRSMALFGGLVRIAGFIGPSIGGFAAARMGLRVPFVVAGLVSVPALLSVALFMPGVKAASSLVGCTSQPRKAKPVDLLEMLRGQTRLLVPAGLGQFFVQMVRSGRGIIIPLFAANVLGLDVAQVGLLLTISAAVEMTMFWPAGWLMDNLGRKYSFVPSFALQAVGMACVPLAGGFAGLLACASLIGLGNGLSSGGMMTLGSDLAPDNARGEFLGVWRLIGDGGATAGPAVVGFVADGLALPSAALTLAVAGLLAALTFGVLLPETRRPEQVTEAVAA